MNTFNKIIWLFALICLCWTISSVVNCLNTGKGFSFETYNYTVLVSNKSYVEKEIWKRYSFVEYQKSCVFTKTKIPCDGEEYGKICFKFILDARIYYENAVCKSNQTIKHWEIDEVAVHGRWWYDRERPYRNSKTTREYKIEERLVTPEILENFFQFNKSSEELCSKHIDHHIIWFCDKKCTNTRSKEDVCEDFDKLVWQKIAYKPIYKTIYGISITFFNAFNVLVLICTIAFHTYLLLNECWFHCNRKYVTIEQEKNEVQPIANIIYPTFQQIENDNFNISINGEPYESV